MKREVRAWKLTPVFDAAPGTLQNSGTTFCIASGEYLLPTSVGEALSPKIVAQLRKNESARIICDATLVEAAAQFLRAAQDLTGIHRIRVNGKLMTATEIADALLGVRP